GEHTHLKPVTEGAPPLPPAGRVLPQLTGVDQHRRPRLEDLDRDVAGAAREAVAPDAIPPAAGAAPPGDEEVRVVEAAVRLLTVDVDRVHQPVAGLHPVGQRTLQRPEEE